MKKSTMYLVLGAVVLALIAYFVTRKPERTAPKKLDIAGYATPKELEDEKKRSMMDSGKPIAYPVDEVIVERAEGRMRLLREGEGDTLAWKLAEPVDATAVKYLVEQMVENFKSPTTRSDARTIKEADFARFDFEPARRIGLTLKSKGAVWNGVDLIIGQVVRDDAADGAVKGTWVMVRGDETTAFLLADKDLRTAVDKTLADLRDKKVFGFEPDSLSRIEVTPPSGTKLVLTSETKDSPPPEGAEPDAKPTKTTTWTLVEPAGVKGDASISSVSRNIANLRVNDFVAVDKATDEAKKALAGPLWTIAFKVGEQTTTLEVADVDSDPAWARIAGRNELLSLSRFSANNLRKGLEELKDKTVWDVPQTDLIELTLKGPDGPITVARQGSGWRFVTPNLPWAADPGGILGSAARVTAARWARPDEFDAARKSLQTPDFTIAVKTASLTRTLSLSALLPATDGEPQNRWAALGDVASATPFLLSDSAAKRFVTSTDGLRDKKLYPDLKAQLTGLTVQLAGTSEVVKLEKPSTGGDLTVVDVAPDKVANDEAVRTLIATLSNLEVKAFHESKTPAETGLSPEKCTRVSVRLADGSTFDLLISATSAGEGEVYAMATGGPLANIPASINEYQAKNLQKGMADLSKPGAEVPAPSPTP